MSTRAAFTKFGNSMEGLSHLTLAKQALMLPSLQAHSLSKRLCLYNLELRWPLRSTVYAVA